MTKLHKADGGVFTRCRATVRQGQGVKDCPLEIEGAEVSHVVGLSGIAEAGGGIMRKPLGNGEYRDTYVMALPNGGYMTSTGHQERIYDRTGKLIPEVERRRQRRRDQREGKFPDLNAMEQWQVDEEYAQLQEEVSSGLRDWDTAAGAEFRARATTAAQAAEQKLYTAEGLALLLEVANRHNAPEELKPALRAVKTDITDAPEPRAYLIQKAREEKQEVKTRDTISPKPEPSPQLAEVMAVLADDFEVSSHLREVQFYVTDEATLESLAPAVAARWDGSDRYDLYDLYKEELMKVTGKSWSQLRADYGEKVLDTGTEHRHFREFFSDYLSDHRDEPNALEERFGNKLTDHKNWLVSQTVEGRQREAIRGRIQGRFAKQKRAQKIILGDPFVNRKEAEDSKDRKVIKFTSVKDLEDQVSGLADSGDYSEIQFNQYTPATKRHFGYLVVTTEWASFDELIDLF